MTIDNTASNEDNIPEVDNIDANAQGADLSGSEDTPNEWQSIIETKDSIISALEHEIEHGDLDAMAAIRGRKRTL